MTPRLIGALAGAALSTTAFAAEPPTLSCAGPIGRDATAASLAKLFGKENVRTEKIDGVEGEEIQATVVFPLDEAKRIEILWDDEKAKKRPVSVRVANDSKVLVAPGITTGTDLATLEKLNGGPFVANGFGWDYGGAITDWKGGKFAAQPDGCTLSIQLNYADDAPEKELDKVSGDKPVPSTDKSFRAVKPYVQSVSLGWPAKGR